MTGAGAGAGVGADAGERKAGRPADSVSGTAFGTTDPSMPLASNASSAEVALADSLAAIPNQAAVSVKGLHEPGGMQEHSATGATQSAEVRQQQTRCGGAGNRAGELRVSRIPSGSAASPIDAVGGKKRIGTTMVTALAASAAACFLMLFVGLPLLRKIVFVKAIDAPQAPLRLEGTAQQRPRTPQADRTTR